MMLLQVSWRHILNDTWRHGILSHILMMVSNDATLPYLTLWWCSWFSHMLINAWKYMLLCFDEHGLRLFLLRERAIWPWWGQDDELITDLYGKYYVSYLVTGWWCTSYIALSCKLMMKMCMLWFMLLLTNDYRVDPIWCMIVVDDYHGLIEVFCFGYKFHICLLMSRSCKDLCYK